jgi:hypothetical protein
MNRVLILLTICLLLLSGVHAQGFRFGAVAGLDFPNIRIHETGGKDLDLYERTTGFNLNAYLAYKTKSFLGISIEPGYMLKGANMDNSLDTNLVEETIRLKLDYMQMPVLVDFYVLKERLIFQIGPEFALKTAAKLEGTDMSEYYNKDFEISGSAGANLHLLKFFDIGVRYNFGFTPLTDPIPVVDVAGTELGEAKVYNNYLQVLLRFKLGVKKAE